MAFWSSILSAVISLRVDGHYARGAGKKPERGQCFIGLAGNNDRGSLNAPDWPKDVVKYSRRSMAQADWLRGN